MSIESYTILKYLAIEYLNDCSRIISFNSKRRKKKEIITFKRYLLYKILINIVEFFTVEIGNLYQTSVSPESEYIITMYVVCLDIACTDIWMKFKNMQLMLTGSKLHGGCHI